jgi:hypothetical protein
LPPLAPVTFVDENTVQLNVVPATAFGLVMTTPAFDPEQIALSATDTLGIG